MLGKKNIQQRAKSLSLAGAFSQTNLENILEVLKETHRSSPSHFLPASAAWPAASWSPYASPPSAPPSPTTCGPSRLSSGCCRSTWALSLSLSLSSQLFPCKRQVETSGGGARRGERDYKGGKGPTRFYALSFRTYTGFHQLVRHVLLCFSGRVASACLGSR